MTEAMKTGLRSVAATTAAPPTESTASSSARRTAPSTTESTPASATPRAESTTASTTEPAPTTCTTPPSKPTPPPRCATPSAKFTPTTSCTTASCTALPLGRLGETLWFRQEPLNGKKLLARDVHLVLRLEARRYHARVHLDGEIDFVDGAEDLVDLADLRFVFQAAQTESSEK